MSSGFTDKLYWRNASNGDASHCYKKAGKKIWVPLCGSGFTLNRTGGQAIERPQTMQRCGMCDGLEMLRRGWSESGPATV